jgi:hypothetical protein
LAHTEQDQDPLCVWFVGTVSILTKFKAKLNFFSVKYQYFVQNIKNYDTDSTDDIDKKKDNVNWHSVNIIKKFTLIFQHV